MGPTWGPSGADRTQVGPMLAPWTLPSGVFGFQCARKWVFVNTYLCPSTASMFKLKNVEFLISVFRCVWNIGFLIFELLYSALPISRGHFSPNNSRKTPIARPLGRSMGVFRGFEIWPKFHLRSCCTGCKVVLCCSAIYRKSIVSFLLL